MSGEGQEPTANAHVVPEEHEAASAPKRRAVVTEPERVLRLAADSADELLRLLDGPVESTVDTSGPVRLGVVGPDARRLEVARKVVAKGVPWQGLKDVWFTPQPLLWTPGAKTAFLYPGLEADAEPRCADIARHFGLERPEWSTASVLDRATSVSRVGRLLHTALTRLELVPDALAGHSVGEWTAMQVAGMYPAASTRDLLDRYWPDGFSLPEVDFLVLGCSSKRAADFLGTEPDLLVSHENAPRQTIVCGPGEPIARFAERCRAEGIVARVLPFRSGFHTPFLLPHVAPFARLAAGLELLPPRIPVWSATTARPYPAEPDAVRELYVAHLVEPVRFQRLLDALYEKGFRAFIQVGAGQLGSFVADTLGDRRHLVIGAASGTRDGLAQLRRVATALWVEGARPRFDALETRRSPLSTGGSPLPVADSARGPLEPVADVLPEIPDGVPDAIIAEFTALLRETREAATSVVAAAAGSAKVRESIVDVSLAAMPYLRDHRFFRQREDWPDEVDRRPVVPATTLVDLACREVVRAWPGTVATAVHDATFSRWLIAVPACRVPVTMARDGARVAVEIGPYASMTVELAGAYPVSSRAPSPLPAAETTPPLTAPEIYSRREMFHGPAYQGLAELTGIGEWHIRGELVVPSAPGALLDNVGQLLGCWLMGTQTTRLLAFPRSMGNIRLYGPDLPPGTRLSCLVHVRTPEPDVLEMDAELVHKGRVWAEIRQWRDIRFPCDRPAHRVYAFPDRHRLAEDQDGGWSLVTDRWPSVAARDIYAGVYLNAGERGEFTACPPRRQRGWLLERIALKDAVRARLAEPVFPAEIHVREQGVSGRHGRELPALDTAVAQLDGLAVALARPADALIPPRIALRREGELTGLVEEVAGVRGDPVRYAELPGYVVAWTAEHL
ncbi:acyltransferase domain-containing protein [Amycolatopsis sp. H20-H5]|uniref:acyltransferase domain-containing protein n=1 Tax=Amycolatopsis sp. H20-H5 TaxID=3046309 RepID=UPI002DB99598|nr:acyltransferase domain-containing protein [Amycolatopsis sp. H20-H5]MEC3982733.1 acyltransferase domain-containing protein [Amycolatopsis sp. H20-H5]